VEWVLVRVCCKGGDWNERVRVWLYGEVRCVRRVLHHIRCNTVQTIKAILSRIISNIVSTVQITVVVHCVTAATR
jgi:hypothetical protein